MSIFFIGITDHDKRVNLMNAKTLTVEIKR